MHHDYHSIPYFIFSSLDFDHFLFFKSNGDYEIMQFIVLCSFPPRLYNQHMQFTQMQIFDTLRAKHSFGKREFSFVDILCYCEYIYDLALSLTLMIATVLTNLFF